MKKIMFFNFSFLYFVCLIAVVSIIMPLNLVHASMDLQTFPIYSKNGAILRVLKINQEVDVIFDSEFDENNKYDGYAYFNVKEPDRLVSRFQNFTSSEMPKVFKFSYAPSSVGSFPITYGMTSDTNDFHKETTIIIDVVDKHSKAMKNDGYCKSSFPEFTLVIKPDFSTGVCVKIDTAKILRERGWR